MNNRSLAGLFCDLIARFVDNSGNEIQAHATIYNGICFRSRLEARHAKFMDALGIPYKYEYKAFDLGNGVRYTPDFYLPVQRYWVEIKPNRKLSDQERRKIGGLRRTQKHEVFVIKGDFRNGTAPRAIRIEGGGAGGTINHQWRLCPLCRVAYLDGARRCSCDERNASPEQIRQAHIAVRFAAERAESHWFTPTGAERRVF